MRKVYFLFILANLIFASSFSSIGEEVNLQMHGKNLGDILQILAEKKNINILLPSGADTITTIVNFSTPDALPLPELEEYLLYFLDMAGYRFSIQEDVLMVMKKSDAAARAPAPLYVDIDPKHLPDNPGPIRAMYFLKNLKVQNNPTLVKVILDILPDKGVMAEPRSNCLILSGPANSIAAVMTIVKELDNYGIRDEVASLKLLHTSASVVSRLLEEIIAVARDTSPSIGNAVLYTGSSYFPPNIKIIPELRTNSLIFMGKSPAIEKVITFIQEEIDIPQESGKCVVHVCPLKYLEAKKIAPILQSLLSGKTQQGQSIRDTSATNSTYRTFDSIRIIAEETASVQSANSGDNKNQSRLTLGGNRLIIAATTEDYKEIQELIKRIDQPQPQVIIEVMILDLDVNETGEHASQARLPSLLNRLTGLSMQTIMQDNSQGIISDPSQGVPAVTSGANLTAQSTLTSDILAPLVSQANNNNASSNSSQTTTANSLVDNVTRNGVIISLGDQFKNMGIAALLRFNDNIFARHIVGNPSVVTQNNVRAEIKNVQIRRGAGEISPESNNYGGGTVIKIQDYAATLGINLTPRINSSSLTDESKSKRLNLEIDINIEEFENSTADNYNKITRGMTTNATISSGDLLVIGGLYKKGHAKTLSRSPLSKIPLIGPLLFSGVTTEKAETSLVVIIRATVAEPVLHGSLHNFSHHQLALAEDELEQTIFSRLKDPITRMYFGSTTQKTRSLEQMFLKPYHVEEETNPISKKETIKDPFYKPFTKLDRPPRRGAY